ncbi:MAG TPA: hypothetical protein EYQ74_08300 [Planctomycetes bacterium]|nr:hypothetical protein [Planctomycetota bacterium]HIK59341.1 hypothetical protein [Planctomycetota bacterium]
MNKIILIASSILLATTLLGHGSLDDYKTLKAEYQAAVTRHQKAFETAPLKERKSLRKNHPIGNFWPRFEELGKNDGQATLWLIENAKKGGVKGGDLAAFKRTGYARVFKMENNAAYLSTAIANLALDANTVGDEFVVGHLRRLLKGTASRSVKGIITVKLGEVLSASEDAERAAEGEKMLAEYEAKFISEGAIAIDFDATTIDGHEFKLSDYRGKAVLVDFYGFW